MSSSTKTECRNISDSAAVLTSFVIKSDEVDSKSNFQFLEVKQKSSYFPNQFLDLNHLSWTVVETYFLNQVLDLYHSRWRAVKANCLQEIKKNGCHDFTNKSIQVSMKNPYLSVYFLNSILFLLCCKSSTIDENASVAYGSFL